MSEKRITKVKQHDITDCGAACLASISGHYGLKTPISRIRQLASTDKKGTNIQGLLEAADKLGFEAKGVRGDFDSLSKIPKPAIAHVVVKEVLHHFVVIYEVTAKHVVVMDPGDGKIHQLSHEEFKKQWTGVLVLLLPKDDFEAVNEKVSVTKRLWLLIKPHRAIMVQALLGAVVYTILGLSTSIYVQKLVDYVFIDGNKNLLNLLSVGMIVLLLLQIFIGVFQSLFTIKKEQLIDAASYWVTTSTS